jgi:hypothetical protein
MNVLRELSVQFPPEVVLKELYLYGMQEEARISKEFKDLEEHRRQFPYCNKYPYCLGDGNHDDGTEGMPTVEDIDVKGG